MLELSVCIGSSCHLKGSYNIIQLFQQMMEEYALHDKIDFKANFCMKECQGGGVIHYKIRNIIILLTSFNLC